MLCFCVIVDLFCRIQILAIFFLFVGSIGEWFVRSVEVFEVCVGGFWCVYCEILVVMCGVLRVMIFVFVVVGLVVLSYFLCYLCICNYEFWCFIF